MPEQPFSVVQGLFHPRYYHRHHDNSPRVVRYLLKVVHHRHLLCRYDPRHYVPGKPGNRILHQRQRCKRKDHPFECLKASGAPYGIVQQEEHEDEQDGSQHEIQRALELPVVPWPADWPVQKPCPEDRISFPDQVCADMPRAVYIFPFFSGEFHAGFRNIGLAGAGPPGQFFDGSPVHGTARAVHLSIHACRVPGEYAFGHRQLLHQFVLVDLVEFPEAGDSRTDLRLEFGLPSSLFPEYVCRADSPSVGLEMV